MKKYIIGNKEFTIEELIKWNTKMVQRLYSSVPNLSETDLLIIDSLSTLLETAKQAEELSNRVAVLESSRLNSLGTFTPLFNQSNVQDFHDILGKDTYKLTGDYDFLQQFKEKYLTKLNADGTYTITLNK